MLKANKNILLCLKMFHVDRNRTDKINKSYGNTTNCNQKQFNSRVGGISI